MHHSECDEGKAAANEMPSQLLPVYQDTFLTAVAVLLKTALFHHMFNPILIYSEYSTL